MLFVIHSYCLKFVILLFIQKPTLIEPNDGTGKKCLEKVLNYFLRIVLVVEKLFCVQVQQQV